MEGENLRREWLLEARRLRELGQKYYNKAMAGDGDVHAAAVYIKASERLATLSGMNHPIGYAVQLVQSDRPARATALTGSWLPSIAFAASCPRTILGLALKSLACLNRAAHGARQATAPLAGRHPGR